MDSLDVTPAKADPTSCAGDEDEDRRRSNSVHQRPRRSHRSARGAEGGEGSIERTGYAAQPTELDGGGVHVGQYRVLRDKLRGTARHGHESSASFRGPQGGGPQRHDRVQRWKRYGDRDGVGDGRRGSG